MQCSQTVSHRGFTLVEILVVVVILGVIAAVAIPSISSRNDVKTAGATRIVISDLTYAQNLAITRQQTQYIRFGTGTYGIYSAGTATTAIAHPVNKTPFVSTFGAGGTPGLDPVSLVGSGFDGQSTLAFDELGSPQAYNSTTRVLSPLTGVGTIQLGAGTFRMTIRIEPFTGEMTVQ